MAEVRYKEVTLGSLYNFVKGTNKINKKIINEKKGEYPVYSGSKTNDGLMGYINFYDFDGDFIRIITVGQVGETSIISGKFSLAQNNGVLVSKNIEKTKFILNEYLKIILLNQLKNKAKGTDTGNKQQSLTNKQILSTKINLPIDFAGNYDIEIQKEIVKKYEIVEEKKKELKEKLNYFKDVQVDFMSSEIGRSKKIKIKDVFDLSVGSNGSNFTKTFIKNNSGDIPVYGAGKEGEFPNYGYVVDNAIIKEKRKNKLLETKVKYFNDCLTYNIDGFAGYVFYRKGRFSLSEKVRPLIIKDEYRDFLNPEFLKFVIEPIFRNNRKGRLGKNEKNEYTKLYINMIENIEINIPIKKDGTFDLEKQNQIVSKYKAIEEMKNSILEKGLPFTLSNVQFDGETPYIYIYIRVKDLFDIQRGKSIYTKTYCKNNKGEYPVYSADNNNPLGYRDEYDYNGKYLSSSINGIAGVLTLLDGKFSTNADRVVFIPKVENINLFYVKNILEPILRNKNKGRKGLKGKNEFTKLTPSMIEDEMIPIPYDVYGEVLLEKQSIIAAKYKTIDMIKKEIESRLSELINIDLFL